MKGTQRSKQRSSERAHLGPSRRTELVKRILDARPGAESKAIASPRTVVPSVLIYKIMGKMFAILSVRGDEYVILKCDPHLAHVLREQYAGIGHRSHLDKRHWICVSLDADVPPKEVRRLVEHSYGLISSGLTRKQQAQLAALSSFRKDRKH